MAQDEGLPDEFVANLRRLLSEVPRAEREDHVFREIASEVTKTDGTIWVTLLDNHLTTIQQLIEESPGGHRVLQEVYRRLEALKE